MTEIKVYLANKQIPQKPKRNPFFALHPYPHFSFTNSCPTCGVVVEKYKESHTFPPSKNNYCYNCGQALDWGKYNE